MHLMIDLETLGTELWAPIVQIGAVEFDLHTGEMFEEFKLNVAPDLEQSPPNFKTIQWWMQQSEEARNSVFGEDGERIKSEEMALFSFSQWIESNKMRSGDYEGVWSHGLTFDVAILIGKFDQLKMKVPWSFRAGRDTRTLYALHKGCNNPYEFPPRQGVHHDALEDCKYQIQCVVEQFQDFKYHT